MTVKQMVFEWVQAKGAEDVKIGAIGVALVRAAFGTTGKGNARQIDTQVTMVDAWSPNVST